MGQTIQIIQMWEKVWGARCTHGCLSIVSVEQHKMGTCGIMGDLDVDTCTMGIGQSATFGQLIAPGGARGQTDGRFKLNKKKQLRKWPQIDRKNNVSWEP